MTDTPDHIRQKQLAIFNQMTASERIAACLTMIEDGYRLVAERFRQQYPDWSIGEITAAVFAYMHRDEYTPDQIQLITDSIRQYHLRVQQNL